MKVKDLLSGEAAWTKDSYSRDIHGNPTLNVDDPASVSWCLEGAIHKCYINNNEPGNSFGYILMKVENYLGKGGSILHFNDSESTKFEDIRKVVETLDI